MKTFKAYIAELEPKTLRKYQAKASVSAKSLADRADQEKDILKKTKLRLKSIDRYANIMRAQDKENPAVVKA